jgi:hypothetical protein
MYLLLGLCKFLEPSRHCTLKVGFIVGDTFIIPS